LAAGLPEDPKKRIEKSNTSMQKQETLAPVNLQAPTTRSRVDGAKMLENILNAEKQKSGVKQSKKAPHAQSKADDRNTVITASDAAFDAMADSAFIVSGGYSSAVAPRLAIPCASGWNSIAGGPSRTQQGFPSNSAFQ